MKNKLRFQIAKLPRQIHIVFQIALLLFLVACSDLNSESAVEADPPPAGTRYFFNVFGDSRSGNSIYSSIISTALTAGSPDLNFHVGDMISSPDHGEEWPFFDAISSPLKYDSKFYVVIGNHDVSDQDSLDRIRALYSYIPVSGYYSFVHKTGLFIVMNSQEVDSPDVISNSQMTWLENELTSAAALASEFIIVFVHRPLYPQNHHKDEPLANNAALHALFVVNSVNAVFSGHEHSYSHTIKDNVHYMITGSSGSPLYEEAGLDSAFYHFAQVSVLADRLYIQVIDLFGRTRDSIEIDF